MKKQVDIISKSVDEARLVFTELTRLKLDGEVRLQLMYLWEHFRTINKQVNILEETLENPFIEANTVGNLSNKPDSARTTKEVVYDDDKPFKEKGKKKTPQRKNPTGRLGSF